MNLTELDSRGSKKDGSGEETRNWGRPEQWAGKGEERRRRWGRGGGGGG